MWAKQSTNNDCQSTLKYLYEIGDAFQRVSGDDVGMEPFLLYVIRQYSGFYFSILKLDSSVENF